MAKKRFRIADTYRIQVAPGQLDALVLDSVVDSVAQPAR